MSCRLSDADAYDPVAEHVEIVVPGGKSKKSQQHTRKEFSYPDSPSLHPVLWAQYSRHAQASLADNF